MSFRTGTSHLGGNSLICGPWLAFACMKELNDRGWGKPRDTLVVEQQDAVMLARYPTLDEIKADLIPHGLPIDHLEAPKLIEHESKR